MVATAEAQIGIGGLRAGREGRLERLLLSSPFIGAAIAALSWPIVSIVPGVGPDPSWAAGLYMAHGEGLQFGRDVVFTYGPLGFLEVPVLYGEALWILASLYQALLHVALAVSLLWAARRAFPLAVAVALCYGLMVIGRLEAAGLLVAFVWCFVALGQRPPRFVLPVVTVGGGVLAAVELLGKANYGIAIFAFVALAVLGSPNRRRNVSLFAAVTGGAFLLCWLASGQSLSDLPDFAARTWQVVSGYSGAMGSDISPLGWQRPAALAAMALLVGGAGVATRRDTQPRRVGALAMVVLFSFLTFKQGFVRQGLGNTPEFFVLIAAGGIAVASRLPRAPMRAGAAALTAPLVVLALLALPTPSVWESLKPEPHVESLRLELQALLSRGERQKLTSQGRRSMKAAYRVDPAILGRLGQHPVYVDPWEEGAAWAYGLNWRPVPTMQGYIAYTPSLDDLNAAAFAGPTGPAAVLRHSPGAFGGGVDSSIDNRYPGWESPAAMRSMLCHYGAVRTGARWQLLERMGDRCGPPRLLATMSTETGRQIEIPPPPHPRDMVFAKVHGIGVEGPEALRTFVYRARERTATFDGGRSWRLVPATAGDGLILRMSQGTDYPPPFGLAPDARTISLNVAGAASRRISVEFFAQRVGRYPRSGPELGRERFVAQSGRSSRR
jgi:hypothetical protein